MKPKPKYCPKCYYDNVSVILVQHRKNQFQCDDCGWKSKVFIPPKRPIKTVKNVYVNNFPGYHYEVFDQYGQIVVFSRSHDTKQDAIAAMKRDMKKAYTGVLWPDIVTVEGEVYTNDT